MPTIGDSIKAARKRKKMSQATCAMALMMPQQNWSNWENGTRIPGADRPH